MDKPTWWSQALSSIKFRASLIATVYGLTKNQKSHTDEFEQQVFSFYAPFLKSTHDVFSDFSV